MSISNAMQTGVSGLRANATAVGRISDNIANANTDGYRRSFVQMVTSTTSDSRIGLAPAGVKAVQSSDIGLDGALRATSRPTDLAIGGSGFFVVSKNPNDPIESNYMLTRAGSFQADENGYLRNAAGLYLAGFSYDASGNLGTVDRNRFGDLKTVNVGPVAQPGSPTTMMKVAGNVPAQEAGKATPGDPFLTSAEFFTPLGVADRLQFSWQPSSNGSEWDLTVSDSSGTPFGAVNIQYHDSGPFAGSPQTYTVNPTPVATAPAAFAFDPATGVATVTINNGTTPQQVQVDIGAPDSFEGMTQFAGDYSPLKIDADGSETGSLVRTEIDENGDVYGVFDNGARKPMYNIPLAEVANPDGMITADGNAYKVSRDSGGMQLVTPGSGATGKIAAGSLESSNVEVAQELTDLIQTQRAYSSNAKIVTTVDEMLDETTRLKR